MKSSATLAVDSSCLHCHIHVTMEEQTTATGLQWHWRKALNVRRSKVMWIIFISILNWLRACYLTVKYDSCVRHCYRVMVMMGFTCFVQKKLKSYFLYLAESSMSWTDPSWTNTSLATLHRQSVEGHVILSKMTCSLSISLLLSLFFFQQSVTFWYVSILLSSI